MSKYFLITLPYHRTNKKQDAQIDAIIRKATKRALDLLITTSNDKLKALGMLKSYQELREANIINQYTRHMQTAHGSRLLNRLQHKAHLQTRVDEAYTGALARYSLGLYDPP